VERVPLSGGVILASNHQSFFDPIMATLPVPREACYLGRDSLFSHPVLAAVIRMYNCIPVKRASADVRALKSVMNKLDEGYMVTLFPEGTRTPDGRVHDCQPGVVLIARRTGAPIVPVAVEGAFEVWPRQRKFPHPRPVWVQYGDPIPPAAFENLSNDEAARDLTRRLRSLHNQLRQRIGRRPYAYNESDAAHV
jgi:1-acyl-sn-glycerol-3-phosphate acyltransferase